MKALSTELLQRIRGMQLLECFSQNKDELILGFANATTSFYIKAHLLPDFCCLYFPDEFHRSKRNSVNLFQEAIKKEVIGIRQFVNERAFSIEFTDGIQLIFKMHGNRSNIILVDGYKAHSIFKNSLAQDLTIETDKLDRQIDQSFEAFQKEHGNFKKLFPTFGKPVSQYLLNQRHDSLLLEEQWEIITQLLTEFNNGCYYITKENGIFQLLLMKPENSIESHTNALQAINAFYELYIRHSQLGKEKKLAQVQLGKKIKQTENYILKTSQKLEDLTNSTNHEIVANIIMANLHHIPGHTKSATLKNFYTNEDIIIKLNPLLTPQKNAENYYRKAKNQKKEINNLKESIQVKEKAFFELSHLLSQINEVNSIPSLRKLLKENGLDPKKEKESEKVLPYHPLVFEGYSILIGKNAKNNDILTQKVAHKNDLWLHAKDVSGSHVVIRTQAGKNTPKHVIEKAAQWAAFYSKRKTDSLCPVSVTEKKHVRKPKGLPPGAVVIDKEEVVLVVPEKPTLQPPS